MAQVLFFLSLQILEIVVDLFDHGLESSPRLWVHTVNLPLLHESTIFANISLVDADHALVAQFTFGGHTCLLCDTSKRKCVIFLLTPRRHQGKHRLVVKEVSCHFNQSFGLLKVKHFIFVLFFKVLVQFALLFFPLCAPLHV